MNIRRQTEHEIFDWSHNQLNLSLTLDQLEFVSRLIHNPDHHVTIRRLRADYLSTLTMILAFYYVIERDDEVLYVAQSKEVFDSIVNKMMRICGPIYDPLHCNWHNRLRVSHMNNIIECESGITTHQRYTVAFFDNCEITDHIKTRIDRSLSVIY